MSFLDDLDSSLIGSDLLSSIENTTNNSNDDNPDNNNNNNNVIVSKVEQEDRPSSPTSSSFLDSLDSSFISDDFKADFNDNNNNTNNSTSASTPKKETKEAEEHNQVFFSNIDSPFYLLSNSRLEQEQKHRDWEAEEKLSTEERRARYACGKDYVNTFSNWESQAYALSYQNNSNQGNDG